MPDIVEEGLTDATLVAKLIALFCPPVAIIATGLGIAAAVEPDIAAAAESLFTEAAPTIAANQPLSAVHRSAAIGLINQHAGSAAAIPPEGGRLQVGDQAEGMSRGSIAAPDNG